MSKKNILKVPQPISLSRSSLRTNTTLSPRSDMEEPHVTESQSSKMLLSMKKELTNIKINMQKLIEEENESNLEQSKINESLREELKGNKVGEERKKQGGRIKENRDNQYRHEIEKLKKDKEMLIEKIHRLQSEFVNMKTKQQNKTVKLEQTMKELTKYQNDRRNLQAEIVKLRQENKNKIEEIGVLKKTIEIMSIRTKELDAEINKLNFKEERKMTENKSRTKLLDNNKEEIKKVEEEIKQRELVVVEWKNKYQILSKGLNEKIESLDKENESMVKKYEVEIEKHKEQQRRLIAEIEAFNRKYIDLQKSKEKIEEEYEMKMMKLENQVEEIKENYAFEKVSSSISAVESGFDQSMTKLIKQNEEIKLINKDKTNEIYQLKIEVSDGKREIQRLMRELEIQRIKLTTQETNKRNNLEITIQNLRNELDFNKRKTETLVRKVEQKSNEVKKKDEFIQKVIIDKCGKKEEDSEIQFLKEELRVYIGMSNSTIT